ncbi:hypothetical protein [Chitinophaga pinensis]|uniref:Uncharacterized protein n=1 Tax=Chitinophaga pinensis (strain ATCC 43595 / DSM 2588 / LMG 13176 / NBRC 15968 / NCIMB 11800 / UQM 2034) TaxID=485918 RepID=A0A979FZJ4_CHIPD|nr:hypothetical protein [Chitinophaga pinensis]ACU58013.1 hypothetical protein Cpin_0515 [Chitinophaga pinensis DSM 2588]
MKKIAQILAIILCFSVQAMAQCSLCTKTAQQLGEGPAKGLNNGILMLAATPLIIIAILGFRYWRNNRTA